MKFLGIGDNVADKYVNQGVMYPGGNALNFAAYARMLGHESAYLGVFGTDEIASFVKRVLNEMAVDYSHSITLEGENGYADVQLVDGDRTFLGSNKGGVAKEAQLTVDDLEEAYIRQFDLICSSINSHMDDLLIDICKRFEIPLAYDFSEKGTDELFIKMAPSLKFAIISCGNISKEKMYKQANFLLEHGCENVIATRGIEGSYFFDGKQEYFQPAQTVEAVDTLGAGDSYLTAMITTYMQLIEENSYEVVIETAMKRAADFSAKNCLVEGAFGYGSKIPQNMN